MKEYEGIKGLEGREPIGAAVTLGIKKQGSGFPIERDRWHIVQPKEQKGVRPLHPAFSAFNTAPQEKRTILRGNIVHATRAECFEHHLKAQVLRGGHPNKKPACVGNGVKATRWEGPEPDNFMEIKCLNDQCEFRQGKAPKCKPFMRFLFRLRWPDGNPLPTPVVKYTSGAWNTTANFLGFFEQLDKFAQQLGMKEYTLFGFPFIVSLVQQTNAVQKTAFPVVNITAECDIVEFFLKQQEQLRQLGSFPVHAALTDESEQAVDVVYEDVETITVPRRDS